jgi:glucosyl-3-phosphoglycerate synthase
VAEVVAVLVAARDEEGRVGRTVEALRTAFPDAVVLVADDGSRDGTAGEAEAAGARVVPLPRRGKGQALTLAEREAPAGSLLLADADLAGDLRPLAEGGEADGLVVAAFERRVGGGFGIAKGLARRLIRLRTGYVAREPLSGQRLLAPAAREAAFPLAAGFGAETRMTIDVLRAGLAVEERTLPLDHRATARDAAGFAHRARQLLDALLAVGPTATNHRALRLPLVGWIFALVGPWPVRAIAALGLADDLWSGEARGFRGHLRTLRSTGTLKLLGIPLVALAATRSVRSAAVVSLTANFLNQLDTRPGRALKAYLIGAAVVRGPTLRHAVPVVLLAPYDLREMMMLGDAGSNALGAVLGFGSVRRSRGRRQWLELGALATLTMLGETRSLGAIIERTPVLRELDVIGRQR